MRNLAAMESDVRAGKGPDEARTGEGSSAEVSDEWTRPLVEGWGLAHERSLSEVLLRSLRFVFAARSTVQTPAYFVNRRLRNRTYGGVGGREPRGSLLPDYVFRTAEREGDAGRRDAGT